MNLHQSLSIDELIQLIGHPVAVKGDSSLKVTGVNELHSIRKGDLSFVDSEKYYTRILQSDAAAIFINSADVECPAGKVLLVSEDPLRDYLAVVRHFVHFTPQNTAIHPSAIIGEGTVIQPLVFIGENVRIGKNCIIHSNVSIYADTESDPGHYTVLLESDREITPDRWPYYSEILNRKLCETHDSYRQKIEQKIMLPLQVRFVQLQTYALYRDLKVMGGASPNQIKPLHVITNERLKRFFFGLLQE